MSKLSCFFAICKSPLKDRLHGRDRGCWPSIHICNLCLYFLVVFLFLEVPFGFVLKLIEIFLMLASVSQMTM